MASMEGKKFAKKVHIHSFENLDSEKDLPLRSRKDSSLPIVKNRVINNKFSNTIRCRVSGSRSNSEYVVDRCSQQT